MIVITDLVDVLDTQWKHACSKLISNKGARTMSLEQQFILNQCKRILHNFKIF